MARGWWPACARPRPTARSSTASSTPTPTSWARRSTTWRPPTKTPASARGRCGCRRRTRRRDGRCGPPAVTAAASRGLRGELRLYVARGEGRDVACLGTLDVERDCGVYMVATDPAARGRGLATALMRQALLEARERGLQTTSLQATAMGAPLYARLGYRDCGAIQMWERRRASG
ncbi:MAG: GNAT family N-acetyltransferase [Actinobacteria bacterium]|nr:MAG: GNAT family N-acetyltransferase [Actinomycetota bacterium]